MTLRSPGIQTDSSCVAARELYHRHRQQVFQQCLRLGCGDRTWAEDATHDVFVKLLEQLPGLGQRDDLGGWIYRVTVNTCLTRLKRDRTIWHKVERLLGASTFAQQPSMERQIEIKHVLIAVLGQLGQMPAKERVVICMKFLDGMSQHEIATTLSLSEGYVSKLLQRALRRLSRQGWEVPSA